MNKKINILIIFLIMIISFNHTVYAVEECYYQSSEASLYYNSDTGKFRIDQRGNNTDIKAPNDPLINRGKDVTDNGKFLSFSGTGITVKSVSGCPNYIVYRRFNGFWFFNSDGIWGFDNQLDANKFKDFSNQITDKMYAVMASYKDQNGNKITSDSYYNNLNQVKQNGAPNVKFGNDSVSINNDSNTISCGQLLDKETVDLINEVLNYPKYIVPMIILVFGSIDFFKAVIAGKEDEMKKAQTTFIKRVLLGVAVFLVPIFINVVIYLANLAWQGMGYTTCGL